MKNYILDKKNVKILLLDSAPQSAIDIFATNGYNNIECIKTGLDEDSLTEALKTTHIVGVRSKTKITGKSLFNAKNLLAIGRFGVGVNNIDLVTAESMGIPVFNSPFGNTRSVAELVIGNIINLFRGIHEKNIGAHNGKWLKSATNAHEIKGKNLGIIGYSNIGMQVSIMAEALGMKIFYYDVENKLPIGAAKQMSTLEKLLEISDIITLHVPGLKSTESLIGKKELEIMKDGSFIINTSRGNVINDDALLEAIKQKKILGAALDVFINEPKSTDEKFESLFKGFSNVILTPHIGGSTIEAQENLGEDVALKLVKYCDMGSSFGSVNFPQVNLPRMPKEHRIIHIHKNESGIMANINDVFSKHNINIDSQYLQTNKNIGYVVTDINKITDENILKEICQVSGTIKSRVLY